jgi:exonuclease SbcD
MKILHTSDWHLGHMLYNYDRSEEQRGMLEQIADIASRERPDALVVSGDVYHTSTPSSTVQQMFVEAVMRIRAAVPEMAIVITAGNHDSPSRHEIFRLPWEEMGVQMIGVLDREQPDRHIFHLPGKGFIIAIPYVNERLLPEGFIQGLLDTVGNRNAEGLPVVMMAHTTVEGCDFTGHDRIGERTIGGIDSIPLDALAQGYDYLALGHIHKGQTIGDRVRYCGTPLAVGFDEQYEHSVTLVDIRHHGDLPSLTLLPLTTPHPLVTLPTQGFAPWDEALALLAAFPDDLPAYIRLNVEVDDFLAPDATADALDTVSDKRCRFCHINVRRRERTSHQAASLTVDELRSEAPVDIARRYAQDKGIAFSDEMAELFHQAEQSLT